MSKRFWLLKTEPDCYAWSDLERDGRTVWDGVTNNVALKYLREMQPGDETLIYHTGDERRAVGRAEVISAPYPDPQHHNPRMVVVDIRPLAPLPRPVSLTAIKSDPAFADFALVRQSRLSVVPVTEAHWRRLLAMAGVEGDAG